MAISMVLMRNQSENKKVGKTLQTVATLSGELKERCSLLDPVLLLAASHADISTSNYVYIPALLRYYFIVDPVSVRNGLYELTCHVDVLESWKAGIKAQAAIVQRQAEKWNLYLNDGQFKVYQNPNITVWAFPSGFDSHAPCFALAISGGQSGGGENANT